MTRPAARVAILLSTFDGARYLQAQLDSFRAQTEPDWLLLWRDDGSADGTVALMQRFAAEIGPDRCRRIDAPGRLGVAGSFYALLAAGRRLGIPLAFADQDDVWFPDKLARGLAAVEGAPGPTLYCSRQMLVDEALAPIGPSAPIRRPPSFPAALTQNIATGCTIVLDPEAAALVDSSTPPSGPLHDWWSYILVLGTGGRVVADPEPSMLYRQHAANQIGAPSTRRRRAAAALHRGPDAYLAMLRANLAALHAESARLTPEARHVAAIVDHALRAGPLTRLRALFLPGLHRQTPSETALFRLWFLRG